MTSTEGQAAQGEEGVRVLWMRHGQAEHNVATEHAALIEHPRLTALGVEQARMLGETLRECGAAQSVATVYASPLERAVQTAALVFPEHRIVLDDRLNELLGANMASRRAPAAEIRAEWGERVDTSALDAEHVPWIAAGMRHEPLDAFKQRLQSFFRDAVAHAPPGTTIAVVAHSGVLRVVLDRYVGCGCCVVTHELRGA